MRRRGSIVRRLLQLREDKNTAGLVDESFSIAGVTSVDLCRAVL